MTPQPRLSTLVPAVYEMILPRTNSRSLGTPYVMIKATRDERLNVAVCVMVRKSRARAHCAAAD